MEGSKYCTQCGANLKDDDTFCSECGYPVGGSTENAEQYEKSKKSMAVSNAKGYIIAIVLLCIAWGVLAIYNGMDLVFNINSIIEQLKQSDMWDTVLQYMTEQEFRNIMAAMGYVLIASGVLALVTALLVYLKKNYKIALIMCILSSILALIFIIGIFGFIVVYLITKTKDVFTN